MSELKFTGKITSISEIKTGTKNDKEWASLDFEVTESNPQNESYPQIGSFGYFKNGEYVKFAKDFNNMFKLGDEVTVDFNLKCIKYKKENEDRKFYKNECWRVAKTEQDSGAFETTDNVSDSEPDDLPF